MRTTANIDDDVLAVAQDTARRQDRSVDAVLSERTRAGAVWVPLAEARDTPRWSPTRRPRWPASS